MGRHVSLILAACVAGIGFMFACSADLRAQTAPATPPANAAATVQPSAPTVTTAKPAANSAKAFPPAIINRYGDIVSPSDAVSYPLKLKLPFPGEAEVRIPKSEDLIKRQKLEGLATLSDDDIRKQLAHWPAFGKMSLRDQANMLQRIQDFRDYHARVAMQKAHDMGLLTFTPEQKITFEKEYWDKRLKLDEDLAKQFQPVYLAREQEMNDQLLREFSSNSSTSAPSAPSAPKPSQPVPKTVAVPVATNANPPAQH